MWEKIKRWWGVREPGHNEQDPHCRYWTGDRAGYDLKAVCLLCLAEVCN